MQIGEESMEQLLMGADDVQRAGVLSKVLINMICVLNPEKVVLGGNVDISLVSAIQKQCSACLPDGVAPDFAMLPDSGEQYFMGLGQTGLGLLDHQVRLN